MLAWMKHKLESRLLGEISIFLTNLRYVDDTTLMTESEELKSLLKVKKESEKGLKTQHSKNEECGIWSHHFMANKWGNNGNSERLYFWEAPISL